MNECAYVNKQLDSPAYTAAWLERCICRAYESYAAAHKTGRERKKQTECWSFLASSCFFAVTSASTDWMLFITTAMRAVVALLLLCAAVAVVQQRISNSNASYR
jgi:hypothetical protein